MTASDLAAVVKGVAPAVLHVVTAKVGPLTERVATLEGKVANVKDGQPGRDGKDAELVDVEAIARMAADLIPIPTNGKDAEVDLDALALKASALIPAPKDGQDGTDIDPSLVLELKAEIVALREQLTASDVRSAEFVKEMRDWLSAEVTKSIGAIPVPANGADGASVTVEDVAPVIADLVRKAVADIPPAKDGAPGAPGESVDPAVVEAMVTKAVAAIHVPVNGKDGTSVTVEDVAPLIAGEVEKAVKALPVPKDGVGVADALIGKDNSLVLTLSDGTMKTLGVVVGKDGERGEAGISGTPGANGKDGQNGTIETLVPDYDAETRTMSFFYKDDMRPVEGWVLKMLGSTVYRGIYDSGRTYEAGEQVTYAGSQWTAKADSIGKQPGTNDGGPFWQLSAKRGNDGKPGPKGLDGKDGKPGLPGKDGIRY